MKVITEEQRTIEEQKHLIITAGTIIQNQQKEIKVYKDLVHNKRIILN